MATPQTQNNDNDTELKKLQDQYVDIMRQKIGEFMLIHNDLEETRGVTVDPKFNTVINVSDASKSNRTSIKDMAVEIIKNKAINSTNDFADDLHISLLSTLLCNNGFPCQIIINRLTKQQEQTEKKFPEGEGFTYKMPMVFAGAEGESVDDGTHNHYTFSIPSDMENINIPDTLKNLLNKETKENTQGMTKYKTSTDGNCFYRAIANWCIIYGITVDHLKNMTYNIPFIFSEEHFKQNLKVPTSTTGSIPKPIEFPKSNTLDTYGFFQFKTDALTIAQNMKNKIQNTDFNPTFEEKTIDENHTEYKEYLEKINDDSTHCNKYKGNIGTKVEGTGN